MLTVMAKLGSPIVVGEYGLAAAICAPIFMLMNLQLRNIQATDAKGRYTYSDYLSLRVITSVFGLGSDCRSGALRRLSSEVVLVTLALGFAKVLSQ